MKPFSSLPTSPTPTAPSRSSNRNQRKGGTTKMAAMAAMVQQCFNYTHWGLKFTLEGLKLGSCTFAYRLRTICRYNYQPFIGRYLFYKCINFLIEVCSHFHHKIKYIYVQIFFSKIFIYLNMFNVNNIQYLHTDYLHMTSIYKRFSHAVFFCK